MKWKIKKDVKGKLTICEKTGFRLPGVLDLLNRFQKIYLMSSNTNNNLKSSKNEIKTVVKK